MERELDLVFIKERYNQMTDEEITSFLVSDAKGLTPEALSIVKEEISRRNLDKNILKGLAIQQEELSEYEIYKYCDLIQKLPCPYTNKTSEKLNAVIIEKVESFIFLTYTTKRLVIASPEMLDKACDNAVARSLMLGWWGFHGIIQTPMSVYKNLRRKKQNHQDTPTPPLIDFVKENAGVIETYKNDQEKLQQLIIGVKL